MGFWLAVLSGFWALVIPFIDNFYVLSTVIWIYIFVGGIGVPLMTGIFLEHVELENRTQSTSLGNFFF